jgi:hypothetical protein
MHRWEDLRSNMFLLLLEVNLRDGVESFGSTQVSAGLI